MNFEMSLLWFFSFVASVLWFWIAWRAMRAHEKLASAAAEWQRTQAARQRSEDIEKAIRQREAKKE